MSETAAAAAAAAAAEARTPNTKAQSPESGRPPKRTSKACLVCRARKSKCTLDTADGKAVPPCVRCRKEGKECVIGSSNRGGRRVRRSTLAAQNAQKTQPKEPNSTWPPGDAANNPYGISPRANSGGIDFNSAPENAGFNASINPDMSMQIDPALSSMGPPAQGGHLDESSRSTSSENVSFNELQNPSDALDILAQIASSDGGANRQAAPWEQRRTASSAHIVGTAYDSRVHSGIDHYLVREGHLTSAKVVQLIQRYRHYYHSYFPIVPAHVLDASNISSVALEEPHLLTAILVIASKDLIDEPQVFSKCAEHMQSLVSALAAGGPGGVEVVEALLLLAEWTPYSSRARAGQVGRGEEDREAWMHVGTALRVGYFLGLDRYSFRVHDDAKEPLWQRKRLVWTACYCSDRSISIRLGKAFWSRGPGPLTTLRKEDFPMLQPQALGDEDYASIFQANLELTMLFSNVHDVLYSNPTGVRSHLNGGYIKYIDDFRSAIYQWKSVWGVLTCLPNLKATLLMSYDYLRLYTNAFAFHATIRRALPLKQNGKPSLSRVFYNNVGAVGDARFIYEGLDAAKSLLTTMNNFVDAEKSLRYMPLRFYLYTIYAGVFLYRARCVGVMSPEEETSVRKLIQETVTMLQQSSVGDQHPGSRYSQLLKLLWDKVGQKNTKEKHKSTATLVDPYRPGGLTATTPASISSKSMSNGSPALTEPMGDFSWTDLDAIGNFALNGNDGLTGEADWWTGFLPTDNNPFGTMDGLGTMEDWNITL